MLCSITQKYEEIENVQKWNLMEVIKKSYISVKGKVTEPPKIREGLCDLYPLQVNVDPRNF
jgi:hypothetical protein